MPQQNKNLIAKLALVASVGLLANCSPHGFSALSGSNSTQSASAVPSPAQNKNMKLSLTAVSNPNLQNLILNIDRIDALVTQNGQSALVNLAQGLGNVDLTALQNGLSQELAHIQLPTGVNLQQINLVLGQGSVAVDVAGNTCSVTLPPSLSNVLPLVLGSGLNISANNVFSLLMGIDTRSLSSANISGQCTFNPNLGLASAFKFDVSNVLSTITSALTNNSSSGMPAGLSNPQDILGALMPQLKQVNTASAIGSFIGGLIGGFLSTSTSPYATIISALLGNGGVNNPTQNLTSSLLSLPIDLITGKFASGSGVNNLLATLLGKQGTNNQSLLGSIISSLIPGLSANTTTTVANGTPTFGSQNSPLTLAQLFALFGAKI